MITDQPRQPCSASTAGHREAGYTCLPNWIFGKAAAQELVVLLALQYHAPNIHPSLARLAEVSGLGKSTVCRTLASLKRRGWIRTEQRFTDAGRSSSTAYHLTIENPVGTGVPERDSPAVPERDTGKDPVMAGVPERDSGGESAAPGVPQRDSGCPRAGHEEEELKTLRNKPLEPPLPPVPGGAPQPLAVGRPCRDPEQPAGADRGRDGFLIHPAATAQPEPLPRPEAPLQPQAPIAAQPQPQQPNAPRPLPEPPDPEAGAPVKPKAGRAKAGGFEPGEGDVPAALLPVVRELLAFWASKGGKSTERAWTAQLGQLQRIQADTRGGTEAVREQLEAGAQAAVFGKAWMAVTFANWERFGAKATPIIGTGFRGKRSVMDRVQGAIALVEERERRAAAQQSQCPSLVLAGVA